MTNREILDVFDALKKVSGFRKPKFSFCIAYNINLLNPIVDAIRKSIKVNPQWLEYEKKRIALAKAYAKPDKHGNPTTNCGFYVMEEGKRDEWKEQIAKLQGEYEEVILDYFKSKEEYEEFLDQKCEASIVFQGISNEELPDEISADEIVPLMGKIITAPNYNTV